MGMFNNSDFAQMRFNVFEIAHGTDLIYDSCKQLQKFKSFVNYKEPDRNKVIRYIFYLYDLNSPLVKYFADLNERKKEAAALSGFDLKKDKKRLEDLYDLKDKEVVEMIMEYLRFLNNHKWAMIISNEQTFYEYQKALLEEVTLVRGDKDKLSAIQTKSKLMEDSDVIAERLAKYYRDIFGEGVDSEKIKKRAMSPEQIAMMYEK